MLKVHAKRLGTIAVLSLEGEIVNSETEMLRHALHSLSAVSAVKLDLSGVTTVDAGGLGVMLQLREQAEASGIRFELMNLTKQIRRVFEITRLDSVFQIAAGVELFPAVLRKRPASRVGLASCA